MPLGSNRFGEKSLHQVRIPAYLSWSQLGPRIRQAWDVDRNQLKGLMCGLTPWATAPALYKPSRNCQFSAQSWDTSLRSSNKQHGFESWLLLLSCITSAKSPPSLSLSPLCHRQNFCFICSDSRDLRPFLPLTALSSAALLPSKVDPAWEHEGVSSTSVPAPPFLWYIWLDHRSS